MVTTISIAGNLSDFGAQLLNGKYPQIEFIPSGPAFAGNDILAPHPAIVTPASDGSFVVALAITENLLPDAWYQVIIRWLGSDGFAEFPGKLRIPINGGSFRQILETSFAGGYVVISETYPTVAFAYWYQPSTGNLYPWIGA